MKSKWGTVLKRRGLALTGLFGIGVAAALLLVFGVPAGAAAQEESPTVTAVYGGWAADATLNENQTRDLERQFDGGWDCSDLRCHYVRVEWSGIEPLDDLQKVDGVNDGPGWHLAVSPRDREVLNALNKTVGVDEAGGGEGPYVYYAAVPWAGERIWVSIKGEGLNQFDAHWVNIPAHVPPGFKTRTDRAGVTLVDHDSEDTDLRMLLSVFPKVANATDYEVEYTFRRDLNQTDGKFTRVTRPVFASQKRGLYERLEADWEHHKHENILNGLTNEDFDGENAGWIFSTTPLPKLLAGAEGWPEEEVIGDDDVTNALENGEDRGAVGIRIRPVVACSAAPGNDPESEFCSAGSSRLDTLPLYGKKSKVSYVTFTSEELE